MSPFVKICIAFLWLLLSVSPAWAQVRQNQITTQNLDSLELANSRYSKQDEYKLRLLNAISSLYELKNPSLGIEKAAQSIELANKLGLNQTTKLLLAESFHQTAINYSSKGDYQSAKEFYNKAAEINAQFKNDYGLAYNQLGLGKIYNLKGDHKTAKDLSTASFKIFEGMGDKNGMGKALSNMGSILISQNEFNLALQYFQQAFTIYDQTKNISGTSICYGNIGVVYNNLSNYPKALENYQKALLINEKLGNKRQISLNLSNIGGVYASLSD
jgi:tetratricopeptide (TPR) repeat protein